MNHTKTFMAVLLLAFAANTVATEAPAANARVLVAADKAHPHDAEKDHSEAGVADEHGHEGEQGHNEEGHGEEGAAVRLSTAQREAAGIVSTPIQRRDVAVALRAPGEVRLNAYATTKVTPRITAQVLERHARLGDLVAKGQPLVTLSSVEMAQAQGDLLVAEREWQRVRKLGRKVVSAQRYTEARVVRDQARARARAYGMTEAELRKLVSTGKAALAAGRFQLLSAQAGTVIEDDFIVGELVEPGRVLFSVSDESRLWIEARLTPEAASQVRVGAAAIAMVRERKIVGKVIQVHHALDEATRTLAARIEVANPDDQLHPGLFVQVSIDGQTQENALTLPLEAVLRSPDGDWQVFVEHEPNAFEPKEVEVLRTTATEAIVRGLDVGVPVATRGAFFLQSELAKAGFDIHNH